MQTFDATRGVHSSKPLPLPANCTSTKPVFSAVLNEKSSMASEPAAVIADCQVVSAGQQSI